jgi:hypothetical protein
MTEELLNILALANINKKENLTELEVLQPGADWLGCWDTTTILKTNTYLL